MGFTHFMGTPIVDSRRLTWAIAAVKTLGNGSMARFLFIIQQFVSMPLSLHSQGQTSLWRGLL